MAKHSIWERLGGRRSRKAAGAAIALCLTMIFGLATVAPAAASTPTQITPGAGMVQAAPTASGQEALLWSEGTATATVSGSGQATVKARADLCDGAPTFELMVDGAVVGRAQVVNPTSGPYWDYPVGQPIGAGTHTISLTFIDDFSRPGCDRNLHIADVFLPGATTPTPTPSGNPFSVGRPYIDPTYPTVAAADERRSWDPSGAAALDKISGQTAALWAGDWIPTAQVGGTVGTYVRAAAAAGQTGVVVVYAIPARDCGLYSGGGLTPDTYPGFVQAVADAVKGTRTAVILEPDAVAQIGACADQGDRTGMLRDARNRLVAAGAFVYIDAGNSAWVSADTMATRLRAVGVDGTRGFATNVSNYRYLAEEQTYANALSSLLGGAHYVIDTSRNGSGPLGNGAEDWCNPTGRSLGQRPGAVNDGSAMDAALYIKRIGESDGQCGRGEPAAGVFWTDYAIGLAQRAAW